MRQNRRGGASKRLGFHQLTLARFGGGEREEGWRVFAHRGVPLIVDGSHVDVYAESADINVTRSRVPEASFRCLDMPMPTGTAIVEDSEHCNGYLAVSYRSEYAGSTRLAVLDAETGAVIRSPEIVGVGDVAICHLASFQSRYILAVIYSINTGDMNSYLLDTEDVAAGWDFLEYMDVSSCDPALCSLGSHVALVYGRTSGTARARVHLINTGGTAQTYDIDTSSTTLLAADISGVSGGTLWVAWQLASSAAIRVIGLSATTITTVLASAITAFSMPTPVALAQVRICAGATSGTARLAAFARGSTPQGQLAQMKFCGLTTSGGGAAVAGTAQVCNGVFTCSRPFHYGGRYYMAVYGSVRAADDVINIQSNVDGMCVVVDWTEDEEWLRPIANVDPGLVKIPAYLSKFSEIRSGVWAYAYQSLKTGSLRALSVPGLQESEASISTGGRVLHLSFVDPQRWQSVDHANLTFLGGGLLAVYDGERVIESNFLARPPVPLAQAGDGSGLTGSYRYVAIYEDVDSAGNLTVSGISDPSEAITASDEDIDVEVVAIFVSSRCVRSRTLAGAPETTLRIALYRTLAGGEPPYYRVAAEPNDISGPGYVTFTDDVSDAELATRPKLYAPTLPSSPNERKDRRAPPGLKHIESYNGMLVGADGETLYWSGQEVYGEAPWFNPAFYAPITGGGDITAIKARDGILTVFKEDRIFLIAGEAPSDNGSQGGLGLPRQVSTDVGCIDARSVVATELGIFFQSRRGIELLNRNGPSVEWIGERVQDTLAAFPVVTSAVLDTRDGVVRFSLAAAVTNGLSSGESCTLVYDLVGRVWQSKDVYADNDAGPPQAAAMLTVGGLTRYAWLGTDGIIHLENDASASDAHYDESEWITKRATTSWVHIAGIQGEQFIDQILLLAKTVTDHHITIRLAFDYEETFRDEHAKTWRAAELDAARAWLAKEVVQTTSQAIRIQIEDGPLDPATEEDPPEAGDPGNGEGATWVCLTLSGQPHRGAKRTTGIQRGGSA